jgi:hypothetical protein
MSLIWLIKVLFSHLLTDFVLQKSSWIAERQTKHFKSKFLYLHTVITALGVLLVIGPIYWQVIAIIFISHTIIDGWKSYQLTNAKNFIIDQLLHLTVIIGCWYFTFHNFNDIEVLRQKLNGSQNFWILITSILFLTLPSAFLIGELTKKWRQLLVNQTALANAGRWIGIIERIIIFTLIFQTQYEATGLLIAAKTIIRFADDRRTEEKTEYLLIGTLISIGIAMLVGILARYLCI